MFGIDDGIWELQILSQSTVLSLSVYILTDL